MQVVDFFRSVGGVPVPEYARESIHANGDARADHGETPPAWTFGLLLAHPADTDEIRHHAGAVQGIGEGMEPHANTSTRDDSRVARGDVSTRSSYGTMVRKPTHQHDRLTGRVQDLYKVAPQLSGRWDGRTSINLLSAVKRGLGFDLPAQYQRRGTCGGRAGSLAGNILQGLQKAAGEPIEFKPISHAWLYAASRKRTGILGVEDGVLGGTIPPVMAELGTIHQQESQGDDDYVSPTTDRKAVEWGMHGPPTTLADLARDNPVKSIARCRSANEMADALASGSVICISDSQGFAMTRDRDGFCRPQGTWYHYHVFAGLVVQRDGRRGFAYVQSWGPNSPDGPRLADYASDGTRLADYPSHVFGVDWDTADLMARTGEAHAMSQFQAWQIPEIPWLFA